MTMNISMTVNRQALIDALKKKRDEITASYQAKIDRDTAAQDPAKEFTKELAVYYARVSEMLKDGTATFRPTSFGMQNARVSKTHKKALGSRHTEYAALYVAPVDPETPLPEMPDLTEDVIRAQSASRKVKTARQTLAQAIAPYDAALQLLEMSVDENVGVPATEYQRLLGAPVAGARSFEDDDEFELD